MSREPRSDIGPTGAGPDFEAFLKRDLAFCGYLVVPPFEVPRAEEIETAQRGLWEGCQLGDGRPYGT